MCSSQFIPFLPFSSPSSFPSFSLFPSFLPDRLSSASGSDDIGAFWADKSASGESSFSAVQEIIPSVSMEKIGKTEADFYGCLIPKQFVPWFSSPEAPTWCLSSTAELCMKADTVSGQVFFFGGGEQL